jgi:hypothetical protein
VIKLLVNEENPVPKVQTERPNIVREIEGDKAMSRDPIVRKMIEERARKRSLVLDV